MSKGHGISRDNLLGMLPPSLRLDKSVMAMADAAAQVLSVRPAEIDRLAIYPDIWRLDEKMLDILAYDFKVDWWDADYSLEQKRQTLYDSWNVHRRLGTPWAVRTALNVVFPGAVIQEWFEYDGTPYCFRINFHVPPEGLTLERQKRALNRVWYYKNLRSHLEGLTYLYEKKTGVRTGACCESACRLEVWPRLATGVEGTARTGTAQFHESASLLGVWPHLVTGAEGTVRTGAAPFHKTALRQETAPKLPASVRIRSAAGGAAAFTKQTVEIFPLKE